MATWTITSPEIAGILPILNTDTGYTPPNSSTLIPTPPMQQGMIVQASDPTLGMCEFILLPGVASNIVGALVRWNATTFAVTIVTNTAVQVVPVAVSMSSNTTTTNWSWYQIAGMAVIKKTAVAVSPQVALYLSTTAGRVRVIASAGLQVVGCRSANLTTVTSTTSTITALINRPHLQSQIT